MIRRDYVLRMIQEFAEALSRIRSLKKAKKWEEARASIEEEFKHQTGLTPDDLVRLSETELLAILIRTENTLAVREKSLILCTLLQEAGDLAEQQEDSTRARSLHLKGLHLLLDAIARDVAADIPEFVPRVDAFVARLSADEIPPTTHVRLMQYYEQTKQFGKGEDSLFSVMELESANPAVLEFGISFYQRLLTRSEAELEEGNLPVAEVQAGLASLMQRKNAPAA